MYAQHAMIFLCQDRSSTLNVMRAHDAQSTAVCVDGAHRLLMILQSECFGFDVKGKLKSEDYDCLLLEECEIWRALALKIYQDRSHIPLPLQKGGKDWLYMPEVFGDMLCETIHAIRQLLGTSTKPLRVKKASEWAGPGRRMKRLRTKRPLP